MLSSFDDVGLDDRVLKAVAKLGWRKPTPIQSKSIPLALDGKDLLVRAKTGSGKTAIYGIPMVQMILSSGGASKSPKGVTGLVLLPSKELSAQAYRNMRDFCAYCSRDIQIVDVAAHNLDSARPLLASRVDIVIGTPSKVAAALKASLFSLKESLRFLALDEADLLFSYGYQADINHILSAAPGVQQSIVLSATLSEDVDLLQKLVLNNPVVVMPEEAPLPEKDQLAQYTIKCEAEDKFLLVYALLKLKLVRGKCLMFVNSIDRCYKLKLFLDKFSIKSCVLNGELPQNSRCHIVDDFNRGIYENIIATDVSALLMLKKSGSGSQQAKRQRRDNEFNVSRGIDFRSVDTVLNFDFPADVESYIHRVGRTARGEDNGTALSFVVSEDIPMLTAVEERLSTITSERVVLKPYLFKLDAIEGFRYRVNDALRSVTKLAIRNARLKEIKQEIVNSQKLKSHFEDNPRDLVVLRHDKALLASQAPEDLAVLPDYLVPKEVKARAAVPSSRKKGKSTRRFTKPGKSKSDPLKTFQLKRK